MCSLTFFPRILQNEAFRAPSKLRRFQMLDLRKAKTINKGHPKYIYDGYHKIGNDIRKFYHHAARLPKPDKDGNDKISLLEKCKKFVVSIYEHFVSKILKEEEPVSAKCHQDFGKVIRNTRSDVGFDATVGCPENAQYLDPGVPLKRNLSDFTLFAKDESVFKDVLARFPLELPPKSLRLQYRDKKVENTYNTKKKDYPETGNDVNSEYDPNSGRRRRRSVRGEVRTTPIGALNLSSWVTMDRTTEAMLKFMKDTDRFQDVRCVRRVRLNLPGMGPRIQEEMGKRPPPCFPPLRPAPPLQPPPAPMPPLPSCPKPRPSK